MRYRNPRVPELSLTPGERAAYFATRERRRCMLSAALWEQDVNVSALLRLLCTQAALDLVVVDAADELLASANGTRPGGFLIIDCSACAVSTALARGMAIVPKTTASVYLIHPNSDVVDALLSVARGTLVWLPLRDVGWPFLEELRLLMAKQREIEVPTPEADAKAALVPSSPLTSTEQKIYHMLVEEGLSTRQIAIRRGVQVNTVKTHMSHVLGKFGVHSRAELRAIHGWG